MSNETPSTNAFREQLCLTDEWGRGLDDPSFGLPPLEVEDAEVVEELFRELYTYSR